MKARFLLLFLLPFCLWASGGHAQDKMTPVAFNDELVKVTGTLYKLGTDWGSKFAAINAGDKDFSQLAPLRKRLSDFIAAQSDTINHLPNTGKGAEAFKKAMQDFLSFESDMITSGFIPMEHLGKDATAEEIQKAAERLTELAAKEGEALDKVHKAQDKYAADNNFIIETTE